METTAEKADQDIATVNAADSPVTLPASVVGDSDTVVPSPLAETSSTVWGLRRNDVIVGCVLLSVCLGLSAWHWARLSGWGLREIEIDRPTSHVFAYQLDVNSATWVEWMQLPGIGETLARRIIEDRAAHGPFSSVEDLRRVKGIGAKTLEKLRPWLVVDSPQFAFGE